MKSDWLFIGWRRIFSWLVGVLSPVNLQGLHHGWIPILIILSVFCTEVIQHQPHYFYNTIILNTHTHTHTHIFLQNHKLSISQLKIKHFSTQNVLQNTWYFIEHTNLFQVVQNFGTVNTKIFPQNISFQPPINQHTLSRYIWLWQ